MSAVGTRRIVWSNGEDDFCVAKFGTALQLEEKCGAGLGEILQRLEQGTWRVTDVRETIRLGLIGGGMSPEKAMMVVKLHVENRPWGESVLTAHAVIAAALVGVPDDPVGKAPAGEATEPASSMTMDASAAPPSTG